MVVVLLFFVVVVVVVVYYMFDLQLLSSLEGLCHVLAMACRKDLVDAVSAPIRSRVHTNQDLSRGLPFSVVKRQGRFTVSCHRLSLPPASLVPASA